MKTNLEMRKVFLILAFLILSSLTFIHAADVGSSGACLPVITLVNQNPSPAASDSYVDVLFQVSNLENPNCRGMSFELVPEYPFSIDKGDPVRTLAGSTYAAGANPVWNIPYTLRVDKDALDGDNEIFVHYSTSALGFFSGEQRFNITIQDSRTNFDSVIQTVSGSQVSIAVANTGKYAANSVIVRVPDQESFRVTGTNGQMVGNLASGDYTLVSFILTPASASSRGNLTRNFNNSSNMGNNAGNIASNLLFQIYYTDTLGVRRIINMSLPLNLNSFNSNSTSFAGRRTSATSSTSSPNWYLIIGALLVIIVFILYKKYFNKKESGQDKKESKKSETPEWVKNVREKEKVK